MPLAAGTRLGPYQVIDRIGAGGMGEVYRAHDARLSRDVAIKVLSAQLAGQADVARRFAVEARAAAMLNHANIMAIHDVGTHDGGTYVVCELLDGTPLRDRLRDGPIPAA
jgi:serine/threonine protein kinase